MKTIEIFLMLKSKLKCRCFITGSTALYLYGFNIPINESDLDIVVVEPTEEDKKILKDLEQLSPIPKYQNGTCQYLKNNIWEVRYQFMLSDVRIDIFEDEPRFHMYDGFVYKYSKCPECNIPSVEVPINPLFNIITAKKRMNRKKDWFWLINIGKQIYKGFEEYFYKESNISEKIL